MTETFTHRGIEFEIPKTKDFRYSPTKEQIINLIDMAAAILGSPPPKFDMSSFYDFFSLNDEEELDVKVRPDYVEYWQRPRLIGPSSFFKSKDAIHGTCGTSACALGTAAFHGIGMDEKYHGDWDEYSYETFGVHSETRLWEYLFGSVWGLNSADPSPEGAVARIVSLVIEGPQFWMISGSMQDKIDSYKKYKDVKID